MSLPNTTHRIEEIDVDKIPWDIIIAIFASSGFWAFITAIYSNMSKKNSAETRLLLGLAHKEIIDQCKVYLERGYVTIAEWTDLNKYYYEPYRERGGNGICEKLWNEVGKLPMRHE